MKTNSTQHPINNHPGNWTEAFDAWYDEGYRLIDMFQAYDDLTPSDLESCEVLLSYAGTDPAEIIEAMETAEEVGGHA